MVSHRRVGPSASTQPTSTTSQQQSSSSLAVKMASTQQHNKEDNASLCSSPTADESSVATPISLDMNSYGSSSSSPSSSSNRSSPQSSRKEQLVFPPNYQSTNAIPSYFLCPISSSVMSDPVISPSGKTYERSTILRYLVLHEGRSPHGEYLELQDLVEDRIVRGLLRRLGRMRGLGTFWTLRNRIVRVVVLVV
jgi:hypothetical protein